MLLLRSLLAANGWLAPRQPALGPSAGLVSRPAAPLGVLALRCLADEARRLELPRHIVQVTHARSGGAGGQNVNKVATKVTLRVPLDEASKYLPSDVMKRLLVQERSRITKANDLIIQCDEERTQGRNYRIAFERLDDIIEQASIVPIERVISEKPPERVKAERRREKRQQSLKKQARRGSYDDY